MENFSWSSVCSRADREGATNPRKEDAAKPTRVWSQDSGRSERTRAPWPPRPGLHASRRHGDSAPAEVVPDAGTELTTGGGAGALQPAAASPLVSPARPSFPKQEWGGGKTAEGLDEESDTNPTSRPERDAGGRAITFRVPRANAWLALAAGREAEPARGRSCKREGRGLKKKHF